MHTVSFPAARVDALTKKYSRALEHAETISRRVVKILSSALEQIGNPDLVKAYVDKPRVKVLAAVARKAEEEHWTPEEAVEKCPDLVGFRVVCNNLQDVYRAADLFEDALLKSDLKPSRQDYVAEPKNTGYRAIHINCPAEVGFAGDKMTLWFEIQIRTRLQDGWGHLSRADLYRKKVPDRLLGRMRELAETLANADRVAEGIRQEVSRPRTGQKPEPGAPLTAPAIAFIYRRAFGEDPPDYAVESALASVAERPIRADALDALMQDAALREKLDDAYLEHTKWNPWPERIFGWVVQAAVGGPRSAVALARREGKQDWEEVDAQYRSEMSAVVPAEWEDLKCQLENGEADLEALTEYFGAKESCICGENIYQFERLVLGAIAHYALDGDAADEASELMTTALRKSEMEDADGYSLCSYCQYAMNKD